MGMSRLDDYLRAEVPDETEPASFYSPGATDWKTAAIHRPFKGGRDEDPVESPLDTTDTQDIDPAAAAEQAAALHALEE